MSYMQSLTRHFPECFIRRFSPCTRVPHRGGNSIGGLLYLALVFKTNEGALQKTIFARTQDSETLSTKLSL